MSNLELYAAIYFGLGLVVSLIVVAAHLANKRKESKFARDIMKALNPKREAFLYRVLEDVIVPTLAFFLVWLVWPVVFVLKFKDIFKIDYEGLWEIQFMDIIQRFFEALNWGDVNLHTNCLDELISFE